MKKLLLFVLLLLILGTGYLMYQQNFFRQLSPVVVGPKWVNQAQFAGMYTARERNIYARRGLNVTFKEFDVETNQVKDLIEGRTDFALLSAEETLVAIDGGAPITAVAAIYQTSPYTIVSLKEQGITSPADFNRKTLGAKGGKIEEKLFYELLLGTVGLKKNNIVMEELGFEYPEYKDLIDGRADTVGIYRTDQLYFFDKENLDYNLINPEQYGINIFNDVIVTRNDLIYAEPKIVSDFLAATVEGWEYALKNKEAAVRYTMPYVTNDLYQDEEYQLFILSQSTPLIKPDTDSKVGAMSFDMWNKLTEQLKERNLISDEFEVRNAFTIEYLP